MHLTYLIFNVALPSDLNYLARKVLIEVCINVKCVWFPTISNCLNNSFGIQMLHLTSMSLGKPLLHSDTIRCFVHNKHFVLKQSKNRIYSLEIPWTNSISLVSISKIRIMKCPELSSFWEICDLWKLVVFAWFYRLHYNVVT